MAAKTMTIAIDAVTYDGYDDSLTAAAEAVAAALDLVGYDFSARWADDEREQILIDIPAHARAIAQAAGYDVEG